MEPDSEIKPTDLNGSLFQMMDEIREKTKPGCLSGPFCDGVRELVAVVQRIVDDHYICRPEAK